MSNQLSQISEGGFSDIIADVDNFIEENGMADDVGQLLRDIPNGNPGSLNSTEVDEVEYKPILGEAFGPADYPLLSNHENYQPQFPPQEPTNLCTDEYPGQFNFEVYVVPNEQKTPWEFSPTLKKIFIGINLKFPIGFSLTNRPQNTNLYIRVTPVFSQAQFFQESVHRCFSHLNPQDSSNKGLAQHILQHIIRCSNDGTRYFGDKNGTRLNLVFPLADPQVGTDVVKEFFHFVCKNSCPSGMNRRAVDVIFTLEDTSGQVLGRRVTSVRICSCPKRDREKEEKDLERSSLSPQGKKRKLSKRDERRGEPAGDDGVDTRVFPLNIHIVGKNNLQHVLRSCRDTMASEIMKLEGRNGADAPFRKCFDEIEALISKTTTE